MSAQLVNIVVPLTQYMHTRTSPYTRVYMGALVCVCVSSRRRARQRVCVRGYVCEKRAIDPWRGVNACVCVCVS